MFYILMLYFVTAFVLMQFCHNKTFYFYFSSVVILSTTLIPYIYIIFSVGPSFYYLFFFICLQYVTKLTIYDKCVCLLVFNVTFNNISVISWRSVILVEETEGPGENNRPVASH